MDRKIVFLEGDPYHLSVVSPRDLEYLLSMEYVGGNGETLTGISIQTSALRLWHFQGGNRIGKSTFPIDGETGAFITEPNCVCYTLFCLEPLDNDGNPVDIFKANYGDGDRVWFGTFCDMNGNLQLDRLLRRPLLYDHQKISLRDAAGAVCIGWVHHNGKLYTELPYFQVDAKELYLLHAGYFEKDSGD